MTTDEKGSMRMKKRTKIILLIAGAGLLIASGIFLGKIIFVLSCMSSDTVRDIEKYRELSATPYSVYPALPPDEMLGAYEDADFYYDEMLSPISSYRSYSVTLYYTEDAYAAQKAYLNESVAFVEAASEETGGYEPDFTCGGFRFRTEEGLYFPKCMDFIGFNDNENAICFIHFEDMELDGCRDFPQELTGRGLI